MSVQESLYHGIPMMVIPLFGDQLANGARVERQGCGKVIKIEGRTLLLAMSGISITSQPKNGKLMYTITYVICCDDYSL